MKEVHTAKQPIGEPRRRWFESPQLDLYVWYGGEDEVIQFQICYNKGPGEQALTWSRDGGLSHHAVDDGEGRVFHMKSTPVLSASTEFDSAELRALFEDVARKLEHDLYEFIIHQLARSST
ncbi:MAG: hypothetical protein HYY48_06965 [Gammaproteobacteria bacterium]|nr:hypothetical protein [Gammaproteobacteria bacterium]